MNEIDSNTTRKRERKREKSMLHRMGLKYTRETGIVDDILRYALKTNTFKMRPNFNIF